MNNTLPQHPGYPWDEDEFENRLDWAELPLTADPRPAVAFISHETAPIAHSHLAAVIVFDFYDFSGIL